MGVLSYPEVTQDHEYMCRNPSGKYCREEELVERIRILEAKCEELHYENKRLREENEELKARKVNFREELLKKVLQDDNNVKHFLGLPSLCFFTTFLDSSCQHSMVKLHFGREQGGLDLRSGRKKSNKSLVKRENSQC